MINTSPLDRWHNIACSLDTSSKFNRTWASEERPILRRSFTSGGIITCPLPADTTVFSGCCIILFQSMLVLPNFTLSPFDNCTWFCIRMLLTKVPFLELRSLIHTIPELDTVMTACCDDTPGSLTTTSLTGFRPTLITRIDSSLFIIRIFLYISVCYTSTSIQM